MSAPYKVDKKAAQMVAREGSKSSWQTWEEEEVSIPLPFKAQ